MNSPLAVDEDPVQYRMRHLDDERAHDVIKTAAQRFGWETSSQKPGHGFGFAFARYKNLAAYCAIAAEVEVERQTGQVRLIRAVAAVDSGQAVNPDGLMNQVEGAILQSASWTLYEAVNFDDTRITQRRLEDLSDSSIWACGYSTVASTCACDQSSSGHRRSWAAANAAKVRLPPRSPMQ